jgi:hypothetical protein
MLLLAAGVVQVVITPVASAAPACADDVAADPAAAALTAKACKRQVEVLSARAERSQTFATPAGGFVLRATAIPQRVRRRTVPGWRWMPRWP